VLEWRWFGLGADAAAARAEAHVRGSFDRMSAALRGIAAGIAGDPDVADALAAGPDPSAVLFDAIERRIDAAGPRASELAVTIYDAVSADRPRAWIGRASDTYADRIDGPASFFVTPSPLGLRLVHVRPIVGEGDRRLGAIAAEHVLAPAHAAAAITAAEYSIDTPLGPAALRFRWEGAGDRARPYTFLLRDDAGDPLIEVALNPSDLERARRAWRMRIAAIVLGLVAGTLLLLLGPLLDLRATATRSAHVVGLTVLGCALVGVVASLTWAALALDQNAAPRADLTLLIAGLAAAGSVALVASPLGRLRVALRPRADVHTGVAGLLAAHLAAGTIVALLLFAFQRVIGGQVDVEAVDFRHFSLYPWDTRRLVVLSALLACHAAALWAGTLVLGAALAHWRAPQAAAGRRVAVAVAWLLPTVVMLIVAAIAGWPLPGTAVLASAAACAAAALVAQRVARWYRRTTVAARIMASLVAFLVPALLLYPSVQFYVDRAMRHLVATRYAVDAQNHTQQLQEQLIQATAEVDALRGLDGLVEPVVGPAPPCATTPSAFFVWRQTVMARARLTSAVELYDAAGALVSCFALNFPEYAGSEQAPVQRTGCEWDMFGEAAPSASGERGMLHAQRQVCRAAPDGTLEPAGTIVIHIVPDYRTLPFITSQSPYFEVFRQQDGLPTRETVAARDVEAVIYGWGLGPIFASGRVAWPITEELFERIYRSRESLWTTLDQGGARHNVHFSNDRAGIYAVGYRVPRLFDDFVHLAELSTLAGAVFVVVLLLAAIFTRLGRDRPSVGRELLREVRASFYRKLFLAFVLASILPVLTLALVIRAYFANLLRVDIETEAARTAAVARRVIEESDRLVQLTADGGVLSDDVMVWISQVIDQDVNIFDGSQLEATSERDLFASGLLPTRTPDEVYRSIVLQRLPSYVAEDRIGTFPYMVAAAPVRAGGQELILTVPLADRQREIEREIDELDRGVHLAALFFILAGAGIGLSMAERIADPVRRLTAATRRIARGDFDAQVAVRSADELRRLVDAFNSMAAELKAQRVQLERTHRLEAWAEMARQVAHEIKNPLTPIQLSAEHLRRVHADRGEPLGPVLESCVDSILTQVRLLRQISAEFSSFASSPTARPDAVDLADLVAEVVDPYRTGLAGRIAIHNRVAPPLPPVFVDRTLVARALVNVIENALHAMPGEGRLDLDARVERPWVILEARDSGAGMDEAALARAFEPYFSTKTTGTGLGLPIARRNIELNGGAVEVESRRGEGTVVRIKLPIDSP
jgi:signal transduction histidine kinase